VVFEWLQQVASTSEAVVGETRDRCDVSDDLVNKHAPIAYDASLHVSSSLAHLQLECVPEHLEEEAECASNDEVLFRAVHQSPSADTAADTAATPSTDDGLQQLGTDDNIAPSVHDSADVSVHAESKSHMYTGQLLV